MPKEGVDKILKSKSRTFLLFCFSFVSGVGVMSFVGLGKSFQWYVFCLWLSLGAVIFWKWTDVKLRFLFLCTWFFVSGCLRFVFSIPPDTTQWVNFYNDNKAEIQGVISEEPAISTKDVSYVVSVYKVNKEKAQGNILIKMGFYPEYFYGDKIKVKCLLSSPSKMSNDNYAKYLAMRGIYSLCAKLEMSKIGESNFWQAPLKRILILKKAVAEQVVMLWPEPQSSLMAGLLYGARSSLPPDVLSDFNHAGVSHIVAISGYNVSVVAASLTTILLFIGISRRRSFWLSMSMIILFVLFTGASSSVVRAGIMAIIMLLANQLGRASKIGGVLVFTAAMMLMLNPLILVFDVGFQLSFLSTLGVVYLSPIIKNFLENCYLFKMNIRCDSIKSFFIENTSVTMSAVLMTLPLILFQFGRLSLSAPLSNLLLLWIIPYLMLIGFLAILLSFLFFIPALWLAWIAGFGLKYVLLLSHLFGGKYSGMEWSLPWWGVILMYYILIKIIVNYAKNKNNEISGRV